MLLNDRIWMATAVTPQDPSVLSDQRCCLLLNQANRHGLIAGASGTGKTVTLKVMAEAFSKAGVPVFMADVKGDVTGMAQPGENSEGIQKRVVKFGLNEAAAEAGIEDGWQLEGCPTRIWDMLGGEGVPVRIRVSDMGPVLLSRLLGLTDVQEGVLNLVFRVADDQGLLLIDLKDLRAMLNYVAENAKEYEITYGKVSSQSVGAILRSLLAIEDQGGDIFFGEPELELEDWFDCDSAGQGYVNILNAAKLIQSPQVYSMFLLWMMSTLFDTLPEVGDLDKPKFVFFFDEAHLLFNDMPSALLGKLVQVVKLIRSKGVGVYFITQSPSDIPDEVLAQLSNRVQHGLRAYTPAELKSVRAAAQGFRANPDLDAEAALQDVGTGEALVSFLDEDGRPCIVQRAKILPPQCLMAAASEDCIEHVLFSQRALQAKYGTAIDAESAYEVLTGQVAEKQAAEQAAREEAEAQRLQAEEEKKRVAEEARTAKEEEAARIREEKAAEREQIRKEKEAERAQIRAERAEAAAAAKAEREAQKAAEAAEKARQKQADQAGKLVSSLLGSFGRSAATQIARGIFGTKK